MVRLGAFVLQHEETFKNLLQNNNNNINANTIYNNTQVPYFQKIRSDLNATGFVILDIASSMSNIQKLVTINLHENNTINYKKVTVNTYVLCNNL